MLNGQKMLHQSGQLLDNTLVTLERQMLAAEQALQYGQARPTRNQPVVLTWCGPCFGSSRVFCPARGHTEVRATRVLAKVDLQDAGLSAGKGELDLCRNPRRGGRRRVSGWSDWRKNEKCPVSP